MCCLPFFIHTPSSLLLPLSILLHVQSCLSFLTSIALPDPCFLTTRIILFSLLSLSHISNTNPQTSTALLYPRLLTIHTTLLPTLFCHTNNNSPSLTPVRLFHARQTFFTHPCFFTVSEELTVFSHPLQYIQTNTANPLHTHIFFPDPYCRKIHASELPYSRQQSSVPFHCLLNSGHLCLLFLIQ